MTCLAREGCDAALQQLVEIEDDLFAVTSGECDARAFVKIIGIEVIARLKACGARLEVRFLRRQVGDSLSKRSLLSLQINVRNQALAAGDGVRTKVQDRCP